MREITIHNSYSQEVTLVSNIFLDQYMLQANGEFVKIYLYLLRATTTSDASFSLSSIADTLSCTEKDILRALKYWKKAGILELSLDAQKELCGIAFLPLVRETPEESIASSPAAATAEISVDRAPVSKDIPKTQGVLRPEKGLFTSEGEVPKKPELTANRIKKLKENEEIVQLLFIAEQYLGKTLSPTDTARILYFYDELHFSADLIEYLIEYCVSKGSRSMRYIETVALAWDQQHITTVSMAKKETSTYNKNYFTILKAFGVKGRNPIEQESKYMDIWLKEYGFTLDIISEACQRTVLQTNQASFPYADRILSHWKEKEVHHLSDIEALDTKHQQAKAEKAANTAVPKPGPVNTKNKFNNFHQRDYDENELSALERQLLNQ